MIASFLAAKSVDRFVCILSPKVIGGRSAKTSVEGEGISSLAQAPILKNLTTHPLGCDVLITADVDSHVHRNR